MFTVNLILSCIFRLVVAGNFISLAENHWIEVPGENAAGISKKDLFRCCRMY